MTAAPIPFVTLGEEIRKARIDAHMDQQQLATALGVSRPLVSKWERNRSEPTATQFRRLAELTNAPWLLGGLYSHFQTGANPAKAKFHTLGRRRDDLQAVPIAPGQLQIGFNKPPALASVKCGR